MAISTQTMTPEYLDPDYSGADTKRYHWLREPAEIPA
jgi:hypothetical protein